MKAIIQQYMARMVREPSIDADVRRSLGRSLHASPLSLILGSMNAVVLGTIITLRTQDALLLQLTVALVAVGAFRIFVTHAQERHIERKGNGRSHLWQISFEIGCWLFAGLIGALACAALVRSPDPVVHMIVMTLAAAYGAAISGRNAGRIRIAIGQSCLAVLPAVGGLLFVGGMAYDGLAIVMVMMLAGMAEISAKTYAMVIGALRGQQEKSQLAIKYERLARFDSLTGVENRMAMQMRLRELFENNRRVNDAVAILWMDLDRFKEINDSLGHMVGDHLLCAVAEKLSEALDGRGHVARFGGDEFILICPAANRTIAQAIAKDVIDYFRHSFDIGGHTLTVTASIGIAVAPQDGRDVDELMQHADMALYQAKGAGRNRAVAFSWSMKERFNRLHDIETGLRRAVEDKDFTLHYQPIFNFETGQVQGCEALLRWVHPVLGPIPPKEFIPVAENIGLIGAISDWVLGEACTAAMEWPDDVRVAVNMSPALFQSVDLPRMVISHLMATGLPARRLELEVTENVFLADQPRTSAMLLELRKIGLRLALDDFGTGYSSLSYLSAYAFDTIKVDQSFMRNVHSSPENQAVVRAIAFLAAQLGMDTVAEGIESEDQKTYAREAGFTDAQGFLLCQPQTRTDIAKMLKTAIDANGNPTMQAARERIQGIG